MPTGYVGVQIFQRKDGLFSFDEAYLADWNGAPRWIPLPPYASFCDSADTAEREARATFPWRLLP